MERECQLLLLKVARDSVLDAAEPGSPREHSEDPLHAIRPELQDEVRAVRAAFVTLHTADGGVRGCVGTTIATKPLIEVVYDMARAAALRDPRFAPVALSEVGSLEVEISVLEPPSPVEALTDVEIGRDGLLVVGRGRRGVLLPQVAEEQGWDAATFAEHTCRKAGLDANAYRERDVALFRFGAEVFSEA